MFGFTVRTRQNGGPGSPKSSTGTPTPMGSPNSVGSPLVAKVLGSPKVDVGEIDTRAPFESVKAAVSLFGETGFSPKTKPVLKKSRTVEERVLDKETHLHVSLRELEHYKEQIRLAESAKAQATRDLAKANRTLQELTNKLETLSESKQAAIEATETAKQRAKVLEKQKSSRSQLGGDAWRQDVDSEREQYKASAGELISIKQELASLRQDFDAALEAKLAAFQEAEDAQHTCKVNEERLTELTKEITTLRETLAQVKLANSQAQEEHRKLISEKDSCMLNNKTAKEDTEVKIRSLKEEYGPQLNEDLSQKLEETTEAVKVMQEQLNGVRASDLDLLRAAVSELDQAKMKLQEIVDEQNSVQSAVDAIKMELENIKGTRYEAEKKAIKAESSAELLQVEIHKSKSELEATRSEQSKTGEACKDLHASIERVKAEARHARNEAEEMKKNVEVYKQQAEVARIAEREVEEKLEIASKEAEEAKAAEKLAGEQIHNSSKHESDDLANPKSSGKIRLSIDEFETLNKKTEEVKLEAENKIATAMAQLETLRASERQVAKKVEELKRENEELKSSVDDALKQAEMAEAAKQIVEGELRKWREEHGESSNIGQEPLLLL